MIKVIGFDLDNTLYPHEQYVAGAYKDIGKWMESRHFIDSGVYSDWIYREWKEKGSGYNRIFEESYTHFNLSGFSGQIRTILDIYHRSTPELTLYKGVPDLLEELADTYRMVLITDGWKSTQEYKLKKLGLYDIFDRIYISGKYGRDFYKPATGLFAMCLRDEGVAAGEILYIGDHPVLDFIPCNTLGIPFVRMKMGEYAGQETNDILCVNDFAGLRIFLKKEGLLC